MINSNQLTIGKLNHKINITFENNNNIIIAEISNERIITLSSTFEPSLSQKSLDKIKHIAETFDGLIDEKRIMNFRPIIKVGNPCMIVGDQTKTIYKILEISNESQSVKMRIFSDVESKPIYMLIDTIILYKEFPEKLYYIQNGYIGNSMNWWALDSKGYTTNIKKAHKFTENESIGILQTKRGDKCWDVDYIDAQTLAHITIIDSQYFDNDYQNGMLKIEDNNLNKS